MHRAHLSAPPPSSRMSCARRQFMSRVAGATCPPPPPLSAPERQAPRNPRGATLHSLLFWSCPNQSPSLSLFRSSPPALFFATRPPRELPTFPSALEMFLVLCPLHFTVFHHRSAAASPTSGDGHLRAHFLSFYCFGA
jgi:hypothetical protein